jgi:hypothetical protein
VRETAVMRVIAFAYADAIPRLSPIYRGLAEDLVANVKAVMPGTRVVHISDDATHPIPGAEVLRVKRDVPLMTWHMRCHQEAQSLGEEILFTEPDVRFRQEILHVFDDQDFDIAVTEREVDSTWNIDGQKVMLSDVAPYTLGTTFSRSAKFWEDVANHCSTLGQAEQNWLGDMLSLWAVMQTGKYKVKVIPGPVYNHIPCSREDCCEVKVLHYKGMRKEWLFKGMREAA